MAYEVVRLNPEHLDKLLEGRIVPGLDARAYFSPGSTACCLLADGEPVFAGGLVNLQWNRAEAWLLPTPFFRSHVKTCLKALRRELPKLSQENRFRRVQATCFKGISTRILQCLGFTYEGTMKQFGPGGETCDMFAQFYEVEP